MEGVAEMSPFLGFLEQADKDLTLALNSLNSPVTDAVWQFFSHVQIWYVMYLIIIAFFFIRLGWKKGLIVTAACILFVLACDQSANLIKNSVQRLRPLEDADMIARGLHILEKPGGLYGFYSGHAANSIGFAMCSSLGFRNDKRHGYKLYTALIFTWAVLVGLSRIFVGKHFAGDVLAGFLAGIILGWLFGWLGQKACSLVTKG
ncbi:MAG: phosphatase PAP2 family protein [Bacteroidales bacterium]|nr:phosphatase PAP2 family protein [Bacteroidales bacterium]